MRREVLYRAAIMQNDNERFARNKRFVADFAAGLCCMTSVVARRCIDALLARLYLIPLIIRIEIVFGVSVVENDET